MGHLLSSVNKAAAERIEDPAMDAPDIGTMVVYKPRAGIMRMGRTEFPAIVLGHDENGHLDLFVLMEPEDMMMESHVRPQLNDEGHSWRHVDLPPVDEDLIDQLNKAAERNLQLEAEQADMKAELAELRKIVLGDYNPAKLSVYELLHEFEGKLNA
jgi:hypothetical protein